uniref:Integrase catalytic domain-containing protein n=1 Tax=Romanomermis culicivorax TaxID=13658 RepID=A0A915JZY3_ROMCU
MQELCEILKIPKVKTTAYHLQCNKMVEHFNQTLIPQLKKYTTNDPDNWECFFPYAFFAYNATRHTTTHHSPFSLLQGYEPCITFNYDWVCHLTLPLNYDAYQHILTLAQLKMYESIKTNLNKAADASKKYFDQKAHKFKININDLVLLTKT